MIHVEVKQDDKVIFSNNYQDGKVDLISQRKVTALYKEKDINAFTIAPSRITQDIIVCETYSQDINAEITTNDKDNTFTISSKSKIG